MFCLYEECMRTCDSKIQNIVAGCKESVFLEGDTVQHAQERSIPFIQYLYSIDTGPEVRKSQNQCADLCKVRH